MKVKVIPFWKHYGIKEYPVARVTKKWIVVRPNEVATIKYNRTDGYMAGAFKDRQSCTPDKLDKNDLDKINAIVKLKGGETWDFEKSKP